MAQPVWTLSVDLQTKTATFQTGMADAAKAARGSFSDIKDGAADMARSTSGSLMESRHGVMLLGEEFGVHLPRALTTFIASIGPVGEALAAAFPFLAIIVGATLLMEHLSKLKEKGEELTRSQMNFGTTVANVLGGLNDKLLQAEIKTDELNGNHLAALEKQLQLIDHQSMNELVRAFNEVAKAADGTFAQLKTSWYQFGAGSAGAKHALDDFKTQYDSLIAHGEEGKASDLMAGTRKSAERILDLQHQIQAALNEKGTEGDFGNLTKVQAAENELKKLGAGYTDKEIASQQILVDSLNAQADAQRTINQTKAQDKANTTQTADDKTAGDADKVFRINAEAQRKADEEAEKLREEAYKTAVSGLQENEREKIDATRQGTAARLAAIDAAVKEEESRGLQETAFYKSLLTGRVALVRQMTQEEDKLRAEAGKEAADHEMKMGELQLAADKQAAQLRVAQGRMGLQEMLDMELGFAAQEYDLKKQELNKEIAALDQSDKESENKKKALNDKLLELDQQFESQDSALMNQAQQKQIASLQAFQKRMIDTFADGFTQVLMRKESFSHMMQQIDGKIAADALKSALQGAAELATVQGRKHLGDARTAAADAFASAGNPILGTVLAAATFAEVMALDSGGIVPGLQGIDTVPAMLTPGEAVLPKHLTEMLTQAARNNSGGSGGGDSHYHYNPTIHIQALDRDGVDHVLTKHADTVKKHFAHHARLMNR
jgi:hypothetical protein